MAQEEEPADFYVNSARFSTGVYDFLLEFGIQEPSTDPSRPAGVRQLVRLRMSPQHALVLSKVLAEQIRQYQAQVGKIDVPAQIFRQMGIEP